MTTIYQVYKQSETKTFIIGETGNHEMYNIHFISAKLSELHIADFILHTLTSFLCHLATI